MIPPFAVLALAAVQAAPAPPLAADETKAVARAAGIGSTVFAFDRAAWVSTDALKAALPADRLSGVGGYVVEVAADRTLVVTYYAGAGDTARAVFVASVREGRVIDSRVIAEPAPLTDAQRRLARARDAALAEAKRRNYRPCTAASFNTVVLPGRDGSADAVYLLSAQVKTGVYPLGGHFRISVDAAGKAVSARPFSVSCLMVETPKLPPGAKTAALFVTHLLDPVPTEIHVFTSFTARTPLIVATGDKRQWGVLGARIAPLDRPK